MAMDKMPSSSRPVHPKMLARLWRRPSWLYPFSGRDAFHRVPDIPSTVVEPKTDDGNPTPCSHRFVLMNG